MTPNTAVSTATTAAVPEAVHHAGAAPSSPNEAVIAAIRGHHAELAESLRVRTDVVLSAARAGDCTKERDELHNWYQAELTPHIVAEEQALYSPAAHLDATRLLVSGMLAEHRALARLIADLAVAPQAFDVAITAAAAHALFTAHLLKENDLLLPALDTAGLDLAAILNGMHEILGHAHSAAESAKSAGSASSADCGCGCGHDGAAPEPVEITAAPTGAALPASPGTGTAPDTSEELDVRALPHGQRHEIIFTKLDALAPGESLVIVNDHDPVPLRYQATALWPDRFEWNYREAGPKVWRVAISRAE